MEGAGPAFRFVGTHRGSAAPSTFESRVWDRQRAPMIDGIEILGVHPDACGIEATGRCNDDNAMRHSKNVACNSLSGA